MSKLSELFRGMFASPGPRTIPGLGTPGDFASRIVRAMNQRKYIIDRGYGDQNIIYIEGCNRDGTPNDNRPDAFDDVRVLLEFYGGTPRIAASWEATTQTGRRYTMTPINNVGAAIIELGQQQCWQVGKHRGYEALAQTGKAVVVARDANKDFRRDNDVRTTGFYGINQHHGWNAPRDAIGPHSAGCLVGRMVDGHEDFMARLKQDPRYLVNKNYVFRTTVMPYEWIK